MSVSDPSHHRGIHLWKEIVVPTARGLEAFFWRLAWLFVFFCVFTSYNPFRQGTESHEDRTEAPVEYQTLSQQSARQ